MAGAKDMKNKNTDLLAAMQARTASGGQPKKLPGTPDEAKTGPGQLAIFSGQLADAIARAEAAESEVERLKSSQASSAALTEARARLAEAEAALSTALENQPSRKAKLDELYEVPGRRRKLSPEQYAELRANLEHNPLAHPVTVRVRQNGGYEIVSGNNRTAIFRELGRDEIDITVLDLSDDETDRAAFYSNLLQPNLTDFEKFIGFKQRMAKTGLTQTQIATEAGVSQPYISALMAFAELPAEALALIADAPNKFGAKAIQELAKLVKQGKGAKVTEAIQKVVTDELNQSSAVSLAKSTNTPKKAISPSVLIKHGRSTYCEAKRRDKLVSLAFSSAEEAEATFEAIQDFLKHRAEAAKK